MLSRTRTILPCSIPTPTKRTGMTVASQADTQRNLRISTTWVSCAPSCVIVPEHGVFALVAFKALLIWLLASSGLSRSHQAFVLIDGMIALIFGSSDGVRFSIGIAPCACWFWGGSGLDRAERGSPVVSQRGRAAAPSGIRLVAPRPVKVTASGP
jgi:hypothetical protein